MTNRYICSVTDELLESIKDIRTYNSQSSMAFVPQSTLMHWMSLAREAQTLGRRMEAALDDRWDSEDMAERLHKQKAEIRSLIDKHRAIKEIINEGIANLPSGYEHLFEKENTEQESKRWIR